MKHRQIIIIVVIFIIIGVFAFMWVGDESTVLGCYVARTDKDVYTLNIQSATGGNIQGTLAFKNFEKDSSSGSLAGIYQDSILLGDYSFQSEGMDSVMQVIFKKSGDSFVRGYGEMSAEGTRFSNLNSITYDASSSLAVFKKEACLN